VANVRNSNSFFIDTAAADAQPATTGNLALPNLKVSYITLSASSATAELTLRDVSTGVVKLNVEFGSNQDVLTLDYSRKPIVFTNGISPSTVSDVVATIIFEESGA
jgi:hypothetical protein